ncbi:stimulated by retinoic acid gene 6 protein-like [Littorina saxatilis]|uniref:Receptor for retinol uptake STRA6 n=1 Tax=Littorina saxatilis TaxID=31220 RepID=A0AAN9C2M5_9CAEN
MGDNNDFFTISTYIKYATIPSVVILLILTLLQRRARPNRCGYHWPSLVVPMRFLDGYEDRWSYALSFGAIASILISVFFQTVFNSDTNSDQYDGTSTNDALFCGTYNSTSNICDEVWVRTLLLQVQSLVASLVCAPHFACITTPYKLVGAILGFSYSIFWIVFYIVGAVRSEEYYDKTVGTLMLLRDVPIILCFTGLCIRSVWAVYICYRDKRIRVQVVDNVVERHQVDHVASLFQPPAEEPPPPEGIVEKVKAKVKPEMFPHFKLPTRIICVAFVQVIIIYYIGISVTESGVLIRRVIKGLLAYGDSELNATDSVLDSGIVIRIYDGTYVIAEILGLLSSVIYITLFVKNYRINMINIYKGNKRTYLGKNQTSSKHVAESLRLPGYQIAYIVWGFLTIFFVILMIVGVISFGIYILDKMGILKSTVDSVLQTLSVPASTIAVFYLQILLVRMFLLQPKVNEEDQDYPLNIDNRRLYEVVSYLLVFSNLVVGLASALLRTLKSFILGVIFLGRLDRCLLMKGFENLDPGYMAYVGTLLVDNAHNNPVMRAFCAVLMRLNCKVTDRKTLGLTMLREPDKLCSNSPAARRWHLAYTLLNNPDLLPRRKLALLLTRGMESDDNADNSEKDATATFRYSKRKLAASIRRDSGDKELHKFSGSGGFGGNDVLPEVKIISPEGKDKTGAWVEDGVHENGAEEPDSMTAVQNPAYFEIVRDTHGQPLEKGNRSYV